MASSSTIRGRNQVVAGFSLIETLIVVAIILIIAAIAIPNLLRARTSANEASAVASVRQISSAEQAYSAAFPTQGFAVDLTSLGGPPSGCVPTVAQGCILDPVLAAGLKSGYVFYAAGFGAIGNPNSSYVASGAPQTFNSTGTRSFCIVSDNLLRGKIAGPAAAPAPDVPTCLTFPAA